jgi:hypothetical protein
MNKPSIAIVTNTYNPNLSMFIRCLKAVRRQHYPGKIQHYILDGGSKSDVLAMAANYKCRILHFENDQNEGLSRYYRALAHIHEDMFLFLESDNMLTGTHWLSDMVAPFNEKNVFSTFSMYNGFDPSDDIITKYFALMGSPDPTLYYLQKSDKLRRDQTIYDKGEVLKDTKKYSVVRFTEINQPVMGDNGFMIRTAILRKVVRKDHPFYHTDGYRELLFMGYDTLGIVKNEIIHVSRPNILDQVMRRVKVKEYFTDTLRGKRTYLVYNPDSPLDRRNLIAFILCSLTVVQPVCVSVKGFLSKPEPAWFLHPIMCFLMVVGYGWSEIKRIRIQI